MRIKSIYGLCIVLAIATVAAACRNADKHKAVTGAVFDISPEYLSQRRDTVIEFGRLRSGETMIFDAKIRNTGTEPLVIKNILTSCGCTTAEYERKSIGAGKCGDVRFQFDSEGRGGFQQILAEMQTSASEHKFIIILQGEVDFPDYNW